ncbi:MAG: flagellar protein [Lachnospiraceae bacterium]|nr:flagellar protein [Lachnospiraceae bacterium]
MQVNQNQFLSIEQLKDQYLNQARKPETARTRDGFSFQEILEGKTAGTAEGTLRFSKHAMNRLVERNIRLTDDQLDRLNEGTMKADRKGIKDSLIMVDELAFIVNVSSSTVITAMDNNRTDEQIFTNIDGAVIM